MAWNVALPKAEWYDNDDPNLPRIIREVIAQKEIAIDTETTGLTIWKDMPLFWSLSWGHRRICMPADTLPKFRDAFEDERKWWIFANAKYDAHILANYNIHIKGKLVDTQVMHALLYEEKPHGLKFMAEHILGWKWADFFDTFKAGHVSDLLTLETRRENVGEMLMRVYHNDPQTLIEYASNDAYGTMQVFNNLKKELQNSLTYSKWPRKFDTLWDIFWKTEVPFTKVLWKCERNGILIDDHYLKAIEGPVENDISEINKEGARLTGRIINFASPLQLRNIFFDEMKLRPLSYSKGGKTGVKNPCVDWDFLVHYQNDVPLAKLALQHRELSKLLGTYVKGLAEHYDRHGRIHSRFNQDVARTGRLSSASPNIQQIPNPDNDKFKIKGAFIAPPKHNLICVDYEALEMRLLAAASTEKDMIQIFLDGKDIHMGNAEMVFNLPYEDIKAAKKKPKDQLTDYDKRCIKARGDIKAIGFGLNYGMKAKLLSKNLGCDEKHAQDLMDQYMARYPAVKKFYDEAIAETKLKGYAWTLMGRRRFLPEIESMSQGDRWGAERQAVNMQIQGTAADAARMAMIHIDEADLEGRYGCKMLMQVHDELVFECPDENCDVAIAEIKEWMEHPFPEELEVPLTVAGNYAKNWADAK